MGRRRKSEAQKNLEHLRRRILKAQASPQGQWVKFRLKVRDVEWQYISGEDFLGLCNRYKHDGKEKLEDELYFTYGPPLFLLYYKYLFAIKKPERAIPQLMSIQLPKPLKKLTSEAFLELVSKLAEKQEMKNQRDNASSQLYPESFSDEVD
jgi:hypothetical protein